MKNKYINNSNRENKLFGKMFSEYMVGNVKGVIVLDNEGRRIIAKYYN